MRTRPAVVLTLVATVVAVPALAGFAGTDLFIPMAGRGVGAYPSNWFTTVYLHNPNVAAVEVDVTFLERNKDNVANPPPVVTEALAAGETRVYENIVEATFGRTGTVYGAVRIQCPSRVVASARVYSKESESAPLTQSFGQDFAATPASFAIGLDESTDILGGYTTQPYQDSDARFNIGCVETTGIGSATVRWIARDAAGVEQAHYDRAVPRLSQTQGFFHNYFAGVDLTTARISANVIAGSGRVICYGSLVTNDTTFPKPVQDPTTFEMVYSDGLLAESAGGTVTGVTAGAGLTGGGTDGDVTLAVGAGAGIAVDADSVSLADDIEVESVTAGVADLVDVTFFEGEARAADGSLNVLIGPNFSAPDRGLVAVANAAGSTRAEMYSQSGGGLGVIRNYGPNGTVNVALGGNTADGNPDFGELAVYDDGSRESLLAWIDVTSRAGQLATYGPNDKGNVWLSNSSASADLGAVWVMDDKGWPGVQAAVLAPEAPAGMVATYGPNHQANGVLSALTDDHNLGYFALFDETGMARVTANPRKDDSAGELCTWGPNNSRNIRLSSIGGNYGYLEIYNDASLPRLVAWVNSTSKAGRLSTMGPNGLNNVVLSHLPNDYNHGWIGVYNAAGSVVSAMSSTSEGGVVVAGSSKSVSPYPGQSGAQIVYGRPEGPEAGLYVRGRVALEDGRAAVTLPDHFTVLADLGTLSVHLTPHSLNSLGVGVDRIAGNVILIGELAGGRGAYEVSYMVQAARLGTADEPVVQSEAEVALRFGIGPQPHPEAELEVMAAAAASEGVPAGVLGPEQRQQPPRRRGASGY